MDKAPGYVYILTNPSFKADWVEIVNSSRLVDIRTEGDDHRQNVMDIFDNVERFSIDRISQNDRRCKACSIAFVRGKG